MSEIHPTTPTEAIDTTERVIVKSAPGEGGYRRLEYAPGENHLRRTELLGDETDGTDGISGWDARRETLSRFLHITDFQLADLASPSRVEFLQRLAGDAEWSRMLPAYRPQEFLLLQAIESIIRTVRASVTLDGRTADFVVTTGDNTDSAQINELRQYLSMMNGGRIRPGETTRNLRDTVTLSKHPSYWNPEPGTTDEWKSCRGFPSYAGAIETATFPFDAAGVGLPWLACFGNHDCLVQGRAAAPRGYDDFLVGDRKPVDRPSTAPVDGDALADYVDDAGVFSTGPSVGIEARNDRRIVSKQEYVAEHRAAGGTPDGHGFTVDNERNGTAYYCHDDVPGLRVITLDTTNPAGHVDGCIDDAQLRWLEGRLREVHSTWVDADGSMQSGEATDRLVLLCSHHGISTLTNGYRPSAETGPLHLADEVEALLHRYPNVILWVSGHTHKNAATPRPGGSGGFWELSTSSVAEWPVQLRSITVEVAPGRGAIIRSTMIDSQVDPAPSGGTTLADLAALHREAAANDPYSVGGLSAEGHASDRNVELYVQLPASTLHSLSQTGGLSLAGSPTGSSRAGA